LLIRILLISSCSQDFESNIELDNTTSTTELTADRPSQVDFYLTELLALKKGVVLFKIEINNENAKWENKENKYQETLRNFEEINNDLRNLNNNFIKITYPSYMNIAQVHNSLLASLSLSDLHSENNLVGLKTNDDGYIRKNSLENLNIELDYLLNLISIFEYEVNYSTSPFSTFPNTSTVAPTTTSTVAPTTTSTVAPTTTSTVAPTTTSTVAPTTTSTVAPTTTFVEEGIVEVADKCYFQKNGKKIPLQGKIYFTDNQRNADLIVYITSNTLEGQRVADLIVYSGGQRGSYSCGEWYVTESIRRPRFYFYITNTQRIADIIIYETSSQITAGLNK